MNLSNKTDRRHRSQAVTCQSHRSQLHVTVFGDHIWLAAGRDAATPVHAFSLGAEGVRVRM